MVCNACRALPVRRDWPLEVRSCDCVVHDCLIHLSGSIEYDNLQQRLRIEEAQRIFIPGFCLIDSPGTTDRAHVGSKGHAYNEQDSEHPSLS